MKPYLFVIAMLLSSASFAQTNTQNEIIALSKNRIKWLLENNSDSLINLYDANSVTVHSNGMTRTAKDQIDDIRKGGIIYKNIEVKESSVSEFENTAVLVGKGLFNISIGGKDMIYNMVYTEVYQKKNNQWKLIARHASQIQ